MLALQDRAPGRIDAVDHDDYAKRQYDEQSAGKLDRGKARFAEKDGKLIGYVDAGAKCDSEVLLRPDGFDMATCSNGDKRFVRSGDEFKATFASYTYTLRPAP